MKVKESIAILANIGSTIAKYDQFCEGSSTPLQRSPLQEELSGFNPLGSIVEATILFFMSKKMKVEDENLMLQQLVRDLRSELSEQTNSITVTDNKEDAAVLNGGKLGESERTQLENSAALEDVNYNLNIDIIELTSTHKILCSRFDARQLLYKKLFDQHTKFFKNYLELKHFCDSIFGSVSAEKVNSFIVLAKDVSNYKRIMLNMDEFKSDLNPIHLVKNDEESMKIIYTQVRNNKIDSLNSNLSKQSAEIRILKNIISSSPQKYSQNTTVSTNLPNEASSKLSSPTDKLNFLFGYFLSYTCCSGKEYFNITLCRGGEQEQWLEFKDASSGDYYYYNPESK